MRDSDVWLEGGERDVCVQRSLGDKSNYSAVVVRVAEHFSDNKTVKVGNGLPAQCYRLDQGFVAFSFDESSNHQH